MHETRDPDHAICLFQVIKTRDIMAFFFVFEWSWNRWVDFPFFIH